MSNSHPERDRTMHTLARGTMARNEPMDSLEGEQGVVHRSK